jgi:UDPglucose--hexose-1-phosphate uridylyltransferase
VTGAPARTELRRDPVSGRWVLVRSALPRMSWNGACPLCPGHEGKTPPEITAYRTNGQSSNSPDWLVRVIPERAPLLQIEGDIQREGAGIFDKVSGRGASEIVIERPDHSASWDALPTQDVERVLWMYRDRVEDLKRDAQIRAILVLRRERTPADRISHPFSRIVGAPIVFDDLRLELATARHHFSLKQRCLFCDIIRQESQEGIRVVEETSRFLVFCPYGSRRPFETWVMPRIHRHRFEDFIPDEAVDLARTLQRTYWRQHAVQPGVPLDFVLHTSPNELMRLRDDDWQSLVDDYHWHIEVAPDGRVRDTVGGFAVNSVLPETAAKQLRDAI